ncbi:MAG: EAL domain-containing protein [Gammaproteobacteria bacterium]
MQKQRMHISQPVRWLCLLLLLALCHRPVLAQSWPVQVNADTVSLLLPTPLPTVQDERAIPAAEWLQAEMGSDLYADSIRPSPDTYWHRLTFTAAFNDPAPRTFYLVADTHILRHLVFFVFRNGALLHQQQEGLREVRGQPDHAAHRHYHGIVVPLEIHDGDTLTILIRKQNDGPSILPLRLLNADAFEVHQQHQFMTWGGLLAILLVLALYNALIYAMHPGPAYRWYLLFHSITFFYFSGLHGYGFLLWPDALQLALAQNIMPMNFLLLWLVIQFARVFLDARTHTPQLERFAPGFTWLCLPGAVLACLLPEYQMIPAFSLLQVCGSLYVVVMGFQALQRKFRPARYFLLSWLCTAIGAGIGMLTFVGVLPPNFFTLHAFALGTLGELILLSLALADRIKFMENHALAQAFVDPQTNAPNFSFFKNRFPEQLPSLQQRYPNLFVVVLDLHGFRELVGLLGPDVLKLAYDRHVERSQHLLANRNWAVPIRTLQRQDAYLMTLPGGQEMLLVNTASPSPESVKPILKELLDMADEAITVNDINSKIGFRIGCAPFRPEQHSIFECFRQAQVALLTAHRNRQPWEIYTGEQDVFIKHRLSLLSDLRQALVDDQLSIHIQPQINMHSQKVVGGEVLVRWQHPRDGFISPGVFIPLAEQSQLIFDITRQVLQKTCQWLQQQSWLPDGFQLSVNLSALDINDNRLLPLIRHCIQAYNVAPQRLLFEVTESAVMDDPQRFLSVIDSLHDMGFRIAIDDFGTGYSSMTYLQKMNADEIKIDICFVRDIDQSETNRNIVKAIVQLARATGAYTVAEGIETDAERAVLQTLQCDIAQGYLWSAPLPAATFAERYLQPAAPLNQSRSAR